MRLIALQSRAVSMENLGILHGIPVEIEQWESLYPGSNNNIYKRIECKVWVDEGSEFLVPLQFEAWMERELQEFDFRGPITGMDVDVQSEDEYGVLDPMTFGGEVIDLEPMEEELAEPLLMDIDGHEADLDDAALLAAEPAHVESEESEPEEWPPSDESGVE